MRAEQINIYRASCFFSIMVMPACVFRMLFCSVVLAIRAYPRLLRPLRAVPKPALEPPGRRDRNRGPGARSADTVVAEILDKSIIRRACPRVYIQARKATRIKGRIGGERVG